MGSNTAFLQAVKSNQNDNCVALFVNISLSARYWQKPGPAACPKVCFMGRNTPDSSVNVVEVIDFKA